MGQAAIKEEEAALVREANVVSFITLFRIHYVACEYEAPSFKTPKHISLSSAHL